jgi:hypothetical protein
MAIRVNPGAETPRLVSRTSNVRLVEWDSARGNHQGQRPRAAINRPDTGPYLTEECQNDQFALAKQEPSTQDTIARYRGVRLSGVRKSARSVTPDVCGRPFGCKLFLWTDLGM